MPQLFGYGVQHIGSSTAYGAVIVGFGVIPIAWPMFWGSFPQWWQTIFDFEISAAAIMAFLLNLFFNVLLHPPRW